MKKILIFSFLLTFLFKPFKVFAIPPGGGISNSFPIKAVFDPAQAFNSFGDLASVILTILTGLAGALSIFFIIIGGIKFVTASGDEKKLASAQATITYAIIGIIVTALAFVILQVVQRFLGSNINIS